MRLQNAIRQHAASMDASGAVVRWGTVASNHPTDMTVKVLLQPEGATTGWLPVASSMVGSGWGIVHKYPVGTPVLCLPDAGDSGNLVVIGASWSKSRMPPAAPEGELWLVHSTGAAIKLLASGHITLQDPSGTTMAFTNNGTVLLIGSLVVTGDITDLNGAHGTMAAFRTAYDAHAHTGVQVGGGTTAGTDHTV